MKLYVWIFMIKMFVRGTIALWLGTDWDPSNDDDDDDDNYGKVGGSFTDNERDNNKNSVGGSKWNETNHRGMFDSPEGKNTSPSPVRNSIGGGMVNSEKFQKNKPSDYEKRV